MRIAVFVKKTDKKWLQSGHSKLANALASDSIDQSDRRPIVFARFEKTISRQMPRSQTLCKTLEKYGLQPAAPIRLADRKHCALSTQPNPHLVVDGDLAESIKRSASDQLANLVAYLGQGLGRLRMDNPAGGPGGAVSPPPPPQRGLGQRPGKF